MHMLYHVADRSAAVRELRRVTAPDGQALVVLNGADHLAELREMLSAALGSAAQAPMTESLRLEEGQTVLGLAFEDVACHDVVAELVITSAQPVIDYVLSMNVVKSGLLAGDEVRSLVDGCVAHALERHGAFRITTHSGCLVCR